ncbi:MAG TPA: hypothetical protein VHL80_09875 [Polyangia bacterium]|nr:hypothetical protein [Polyangia bacterium]
MKGLALAVAVIAGAAALSALLAAGCATAPLEGDERPLDYTPDGGWAKYVPTTGPNYGPNPAAAAAGGVQLDPVVPVGYSPLK